MVSLLATHRSCAEVIPWNPTNRHLASVSDCPVCSTPSRAWLRVPGGQERPAMLVMRRSPGVQHGSRIFASINRWDRFHKLCSAPWNPIGGSRRSLSSEDESRPSAALNLLDMPVSTARFKRRTPDRKTRLGLGRMAAGICEHWPRVGTGSSALPHHLVIQTITWISTQFSTEYSMEHSTPTLEVSKQRGGRLGALHP